jgi:hypothetical protein
MITRKLKPEVMAAVSIEFRQIYSSLQMITIKNGI